MGNQFRKISEIVDEVHREFDIVNAWEDSKEKTKYRNILRAKLAKFVSEDPEGLAKARSYKFD